MKKLLILLTFFSNAFAFSQDYLVVDNALYNCYYEYKFLTDSTDLESYDAEYMVLQIGKKHSKFVSENNLFTDSVLYSHKDEPFTTAKIQKIMSITIKRRTHSYASSKIFKHYPDANKVLTVNRFNKKYLQVTENMPFKWNINTAETKIILKHKCHKATVDYAGRKYIAWFTTEIPFSNGPYKFIGLPGLIMKIRDTQNQHVFEIKRIEKVKNNEPIIFIQNQRMMTVSAKEFAKAQQTHNMEKYNQLQNNTKYKFNSEDARIRALDRVKSRNNPIEKY